MGLMRKIVLLAVLAVACGAASIQAQTLALAYHKGDVQKYTYHSTAKETINTGRTDIPVNIDMTAKETVTVKSVDAAGAADVSVALTDVILKSETSGTSNSSTITVPPEDDKIAPDGRLLSINGTTPQGVPLGLGPSGNV